MKSEAMPVSFQHMCSCSVIESLHMSEPFGTIGQKAAIKKWSCNKVISCSFYITQSHSPKRRIATSVRWCH